MRAVDLIQLLMKAQNSDKDVRVVDVRTGAFYEIEDAKDFSSYVELFIDLGEDIVPDVDCMCDCDGCEDCVDA